MFENKIELNENEVIVLLNYLGFDGKKIINDICDPRKQLHELSTHISKSVYWIVPLKNAVDFKVEITGRSVHVETDARTHRETITQEKFYPHKYEKRVYFIK